MSGGIIMDREELADKIIETEPKKLQGDKDVWEEHIYFSDNVLIVGYKENEDYCAGHPEGKCVRYYSWYWELRDTDSWAVLQENHEGDYTFCTEFEKCKWSDQDFLDDIADEIAEEVFGWLQDLKHDNIE
jgi:hypothetical protein